MAAELLAKVKEFGEKSKGAKRVLAVVEIEDLKKITVKALELGVPRYLLMAYVIHRGLEALESEAGGS